MISHQDGLCLTNLNLKLYPGLAPISEPCIVGMVTKPSQESSSFLPLFDSLDRRVIDQTSLALRVLMATQEPESMLLATERLRDLYGHIGVSGDVDAFLALIGETTNKPDQTPQDRENVLGALALLLELVLVPNVGESGEQTNGAPNLDLAFQTQLDEEGMFPSAGAESKNVRKRRAVHPQKTTKKVAIEALSPESDAVSPSKGRGAGARRLAELLDAGWRQIKPRGRQSTSSAVAKALETCQVKAVRDTGARLTVREVRDGRVYVDGQVRGPGQLKVRYLSTDPAEGSLISVFSFVAKAVKG